MRNSAILFITFLCAIARAQDFDFYVFASEWAGSTCAINSCDESAANNFWNIHGLWPSDGTRHPQFCANSAFNPNALKDIKTELQQYWSGLYNSDDTFHSHEWQKHGSCSGMDEEEYFSTVVQTALHLDIYGTLAEGGIVPGDKEYDCDDVAKALTTKFGVTAFTIQKKNGYLLEIDLCVDKDFVPRDCPVHGVCSGTVKYPLYNPSQKIVY